MDLRSAYYAIIEKTWLIALCVAAAAFVSFGYLKKAPRVYLAQAVLKVDRGESKLLKIEDVVTDELSGQESMKTVESMLRNPALFDRVIATNKLDSDPRFLSAGVTNTPSPEKLRSMLGGMIRVGVQGGTRLVTISVESLDPNLAAQIANSLVQEFARQTFESRSIEYNEADEWLKGEEGRLKEKIGTLVKKIQDYKDQRASASPDQSQETVQQKLKALNTRVADVRSDLIKRQTEYEQIERVGTNISVLLTMPQIASDAAVAAIVAKVGAAEADFATVQLDYKHKHPKYIAAASTLKDLRASLTNSVLKVVETIRNGYESLKATEQALQKELRGQEELAAKMNYESIEFKMMGRELESDQALYESIVKRRKEANLKRDISNSSNIELVQKATAPEKPIKPQKFKILSTGILAGLVLGIGLAMGLYALDSSLKTPEQAEAFLGLALLTTIPEVPSVAAGKKRIIMTTEAECLESESFRTLRTTLSMLGPEEERKTFLFTSAVPEEGKTFCAVNYAASLAQQGLRTLLIEGDLRCPAIAGQLLTSVKKAPGVIDCLAQKSKLEEVIQPTEIENLFFLAAGNPSPNAAELLSRKEFGPLLQAAARQFDRVVVDSAPVQPVSDTLLMGKHVQSVCMVVRAHETPKKIVQRAMQNLQRTGVPLVGFVFNGLSRNHSNDYYQYSYYYPKGSRETAGAK